MSSQLMDIVAAFGGMQSKDPADSEVQAQVKKLQEFITEHYYNCSKAILNQLGQMYGAGGRFTENINAAGPVPQNLRRKPLRFIASEPQNALRDSVTEIINRKCYHIDTRNTLITFQWRISI